MTIRITTEKLNEVLAEHQHDYDGDCGDDFGCTCEPDGPRVAGVRRTEFRAHLLEKILEAADETARIT